MLLGLAEILIFFNKPGHFFVADTLTWIGYRHRSFADFVAGFTHVDPAFWYRPLAQRAVESLLFPLAQLNPLPYRVVGFALFFSCTIAVWVLVRTLTESRRSAWFSVLVFMPHLVHAFVTYDAAFTPELLFTLFALGSAVYYVRFLRTQSRSALIASAVLFAGSLLSKETAVFLPFVLLAIWFLLPRKNRGTDWSVFPHFAILGIYLALAFGFLHIRHIDVDHVLQGRTAATFDYPFRAGAHMFANISTGLGWAFGIPGGVHGYWTFSASWMRTLLGTLRVLAALGVLGALFTERRNFLLLGLIWFFAAAAPTLPLVDHFLPYYLFAPLVGFALAMGIVLDWAFSLCSRISRVAAMTGVAILLGGWTWVHASTANRLAANSALLGGAANISGRTLADIQALYPTLPRGARLVLFNEDIPSAPGDQLEGWLFQIAYDDPSLVADYVTEGFSLSADDLNTGKVLVFKWVDDHMVDMTTFIRQRPELLMTHPRTTNYHLELSASAIRAGSDSYTVRVPELADTVAVILYALDGKVMEPFKARLDSRGEIRFAVPPGTKPGTYTFVAVRREEDQVWVPVSRSIVVH